MKREQAKGALLGAALVLAGYLAGISTSGEGRVFAQMGQAPCRYLGVTVPKGGGAAFFETVSTSATSLGWFVTSDGSLKLLAPR